MAEARKIQALSSYLCKIHGRISHDDEAAITSEHHIRRQSSQEELPKERTLCVPNLNAV